jgi:hypothetical protein
MSEINFLPQDQIQNKQVRAVSGKLKVLAALFGFVCLVIAIAGTIFTVYRSAAVSDLEKQEANLKEQVLAQEKTEQTLVFVRDRLTKIKDLQAKNASTQSFIAEKNVLLTFAPTVTLKQLDLSDSISDFAVTAPDSVTLGDVLQKMKTKEFATGVIDTISYNSSLGYQVKFKLK